MAGPFCVDATNPRTYDQNRAQLRKAIEDANKAGGYTMKKLMGKDVVFKIGNKFKRADSTKDCNSHNCKLAGFCEDAVYGRTTMGLTSSFGRGYQQNVSKLCIGALLPLKVEQGETLGCFSLEDLVPAQ